MSSVASRWFNKVYGNLYDQHTIAEGKESIPFLYCFLICRHRALLARKGADKHYQGAFGKVEIGYEGIYRLKAVAGVDEYGGLTVNGVDNSVFIGNALEDTAGGGADGNYSATVCPAAVYLICKALVVYAECSGDDRIEGVVEAALKNLRKVRF